MVKHLSYIYNLKNLSHFPEKAQESVMEATHCGHHFCHRGKANKHKKLKNLSTQTELSHSLGKKETF